MLVLLASSALIFVIACSNVANLILARTVRREGELAIRAALGATNGALRRTLLAETLLLCGAGAMLGVLIARPMVAILARYITRFSVRALDLTVDSSMLWVGAALAVVAAVLLAFVPRLPSADAAHGSGLSGGSLRITGGTSRRLRVFAMTQIAASFVLLAGAGMLLKTLIALQATPTGFDMRQTLVLNVPVISYGRTPDQIAGFYKEAMRRITELPGVERVAVRQGGCSVARRGNLRPRVRVLGRRLRPRAGRRISARAIPDDLARVFRGARRPADLRARLQRLRPPRWRACRHRESEPGAADVFDTRDD